MKQKPAKLPALFNTICSDDWRRSLRDSKAQRNPVQEAVDAKLAALRGTVRSEGPRHDTSPN